MRGRLLRSGARRAERRSGRGGGVRGPLERHYAVMLDQLGQLLGERSFPATAAGYAALQRSAERLVGSEQLVFGVEGVGSWGAGLCQHLQHAGHTVVEVERARRKDRRAGKSDRIDALTAAKSALSDENVSVPRGRGILTALRALLIAQALGGRRRRQAYAMTNARTSYRWSESTGRANG